MNPLHIALAFATLTLIFGVATVLLNSARLNLRIALDRERDAHLKATKTNSLLQKANDNAQKEIERLAEKLQQASDDRVELRAERLTAENKLTAALWKVRQRNAKGQFLPRKASQAELDQAVKDCAKFMRESIDIAKAKPSDK